jgi:hypothetical protein
MQEIFHKKLFFNLSSTFFKNRFTQNHKITNLLIFVLPRPNVIVKLFIGYCNPSFGDLVISSAQLTKDSRQPWMGTEKVVWTRN